MNAQLDFVVRELFAEATCNVEPTGFAFLVWFAVQPDAESEGYHQLVACHLDARSPTLAGSEAARRVQVDLVLRIQTDLVTHRAAVRPTCICPAWMRRMGPNLFDRPVDAAVKFGPATRGHSHAQMRRSRGFATPAARGLSLSSRKRSGAVAYGNSKLRTLEQKAAPWSADRCLAVRARRTD